MWNFRRPGGSGTEQPSSDAMPARDVLPVSHSPLFLWRATPISFSGREREMGVLLPVLAMGLCLLRAMKENKRNGDK